MTTFPIADEAMEAQVRQHLRHDVGGERLIAKGPYVYLNRPFEQGPSVAELAKDPILGLHHALSGVLPFDSVHKHQSSRCAKSRRGATTVVATGPAQAKPRRSYCPLSTIVYTWPTRTLLPGWSRYWCTR